MLECEKGKDGNKRDVEGAVPYEVLETKNGRPMTAPTKNECSGDHWSPAGKKGTSNNSHHSDTACHLSSRRGISKAPIEGSCRQSRLRGGDRETKKGRPLVASRKKRDVEGAVSYEILGTKKGRPMIAPPQNKTSFHKFKINNIEKSRIGNTNFGDYR